MKKQMIWTLIVAVLLCVGSVAAQHPEEMNKDAMKKDMMMDMAAMKNSPHHGVMMAYRHNMLMFAKALRDMSAGGKFEDLGLARNAFAEIKRSAEKMEDIHKAHMAKMSPEKLEMMKPMMEKMKAGDAVIKGHILALDKALMTAKVPNASDVEKHAAELVLQLEKTDMPGDKKKMSGEKMKM